MPRARRPNGGATQIPPPKGDGRSAISLKHKTKANLIVFDVKGLVRFLKPIKEKNCDFKN